MTQKYFLFLSSLLFLLFIPLLNMTAGSGLYFHSGEVAKEERTGIDFTKEKEIQYESRIVIDFDFSVRNSKTHYGDILTLWEDNGQNSIEIRYRKPDLYVIQNKTLTIFHLNLPSLDIPFNRWLHLHLDIDSEKGLIYFAIGNKVYKNTIDFTQNSAINLTMGAIQKGKFTTHEVPSMSVRDVTIATNKSSYYWPLQKTPDVYIEDQLSHQMAYIQNPNWVTDHHNHWELIKTIDLSYLPIITYDPGKEQIAFSSFTGDNTFYSLKDKELTTVSSENYPACEKSQQAIINSEGNISTYSFTKAQTSTYDAERNAWSQSTPYKMTDAPFFWHHNKLIHPSTKEITTLCGYGFYTYNNTIQSFNEDNKEWRPLEFKGDTIPPRYMAALGASSSDKNVYYLFGGMGNKEGRQILGQEFYSDLYKIDFLTNEVTKLWESPNENNLLPVNSLKMNDNDSSFYTLMFSTKMQHTSLQVVKGNTSDAELQFIGDSIPYNFTDVSSFADLYYWENENKLIALTMESVVEYNKYKIKLYSINYEPSLQELAPEKDKSSRALLFLLGILGLASIIYATVHQRQKKQSKVASLDMDSEEIASTEEEAKKYNQILLFGGFQAFDKDGRNITYRFSPIVKELFLLIIFSSVNNQKGISSRRLQESLWPDMTLQNAKNNRGVNIKKLRTILEDIEGVEIIFDKNYWTANIHDNVFCDLNELYKHISISSNASDDGEITKITLLLKAGAVVRDISAYWLDSFKDKTTEDVVTYLEDILEKGAINKQLQMKVAQSISGFDEMNVLALSTKCKLLYAQGKKGLALKNYEHFQKAHLKFYNEEFSTPFTTIVKG